MAVIPKSPVALRPGGSVLPQYLAAAAANLAYLCCGTSLGWSSPALPQLLEAGWLSLEAAAWVASLLPLLAALGPVIGGALCATLGARRALLVAGLPFLPAWLATAWAAQHASVAGLCAGRAIAGAAMGAVFTALPVYVSEIAQDEVRGTLGSLMQGFITAGLLVEYLVGPFTTAAQLSMVSAATPVLFLLAMLAAAPESPLFLLSRGRRDLAEEALMRLRGRPAAGVKAELQKMEACLSPPQSEAGAGAGAGSGGGAWARRWCSRAAVRAILLSLAMVALQQLTGINAVLFFGTHLLNMAASDSPISSAQGNAIMGFVMLLASFATPALADRVGRKVLLAVSAFGMAFSEALLGLYCYNKENPTWQQYSWLPVFCLILYIIVFTIGFGPLPWTVMAEMLPPGVKSGASALTVSLCWVLGFLVTRFLTDMLDALGVEGTFWLFAACSLIAGFFIVFLLPETKGKSLQEIQQLLEGKNTCKEDPGGSHEMTTVKV
ncbi:facilitated trehalose transporter Tret1-like [Schistocerca cancellata]|uniref:facilitated trehalose transporter Tret1-like n=1 Tax=Schistocerca cancellata TaxID=274614 RepID=UPI0021186D8B|nr:facilitated trehalose transporter Tret1-like [Schistocerca cancellata]